MKIKRKHIILLGFALILVLIWQKGSQTDFRKVKNRNQPLREVLMMYDTLRGAEGIKQKQNLFASHKNEDVRLLNDILAKFRLNWDDEHYIKMIDSLEKLDKMEEFPELLQYYIHYYYAQHQLKYSHPIKSYQYAIKGAEVVQDYPQLFENEIEKSNLLKNEISSSVFNSPQKGYAINLDKIKNEKNINALYVHYFNLALSAMQIGEIEVEKNYSKAYVDHFKHPKNQVYFIDAMAILADAYFKSNEYDSLQMIENQVKSYYHNGEISQREYFSFLYYTMNTQFPRMSQTQIENRFKELYSFYEKKPENSYSLTSVSAAESKFYNYKKDLNKEKEALKKELKFIQLKDTPDDYGMKEMYRVYLRLTEIEALQNNQLQANEWYKKLRVLDSLNDLVAQEYVQFSHFLSHRDLKMSKENYAYYNEESSKQKKINLLYSVLAILFLLFAFYLSYLFYQNLIFQKNIKRKNKLITLQNATIKSQNSHLKQVIESLNESNQDLKNFARVAAHDIKSPISTITNGISFLQEYYKSEIKSEHLHYFENLKDSTKSLIKMINELLNQNHSK